MLDILIIGAGVTGCAIARQLSRYALRVAVVDAADDVAMGASRANSAIVHAGYDCKPGSMMARMNVRGNELFDEWCRELDVPLGRCGSLVLAFSQENDKLVRELYEQGQKNGVPGMRILSAQETHAMQPGLNPEVTSSLYAQTGGITCPYELTQACARNAHNNGVQFLLGRAVCAIDTEEDGLCVRTGAGDAVRARYVINAAGVFADEVARMAGDDSFTIRARKGEYLLLDRTSGVELYTVLFQTPGPMGKGVLVSPTVDGNSFAGPTAVDQESKTDTSVSAQGIETLRRMCRRTMPDYPAQHAITAFAGLRAVADTGDFVLGASAAQPRLINAAGICSPGLTSAPAIAEYMCDVLSDAGLALQEKAEYTPTVRHIPAFRTMSREQRAQAIAQNPLYGRIICRCESVTEAEIVAAIHNAPGATTLDGVKRRTRAGMGRCQGGFCAPRVMEILSRELGVPMSEITKFGAGSKLLAGSLRGEAEK